MKVNGKYEESDNFSRIIMWLIRWDMLYDWNDKIF